MRITLAFAKHNWIAFGKAKLELDWIFQFNDWITTGSLRITTGLVLSPKTLVNFLLLLATSRKKFWWAQQVKFTLKPSWKILLLLATTKEAGFGKNWLKLVFVETKTLLDYFWGRAGYYWIRFGEDWITTGLHALRPNWSYIFIGPVSFTLSGWRPCLLLPSQLSLL